MFIVELTYKVDLSQVEPYFDGHMAFVKKYFETGHFIASGKKVPRDGGIIFVKASSRDEVVEIVEQDPFVIHDIADYRVVEFLPTTTNADLTALKNL